MILAEGKKVSQYTQNTYICNMYHTALLWQYDMIFLTFSGFTHIIVDFCSRTKHTYENMGGAKKHDHDDKISRNRLENRDGKVKLSL